MESSNDLMDLVLSNGSPEEVSDKIKEILYNKSAARIDYATPSVSQSMFAPEGE
jgi:hypothetical protein